MELSNVVNIDRAQVNETVRAAADSIQEAAKSWWAKLTVKAAVLVEKAKSLSIREAVAAVVDYVIGHIKAHAPMMFGVAAVCMVVRLVVAPVAITPAVALAFILATGALGLLLLVCSLVFELVTDLLKALKAEEE